MLIETTFRIGGVVMFVLGAALVAGLTVTGIGAEDPTVYLPFVGCFLIGALFLYAGRGAANARRELLALGSSGGSGLDGGEPRR